MSKKSRVAGAGLAGVAIAASTLFLGAPSASAHDHFTPVANVGDAVRYNTDHLQYAHLDQPLFGFGETVKNPVGWLSGHFVPIVLVNTPAIVATGHTADGGSPNEQGPHDHGTAPSPSGAPASSTGSSTTPEHSHEGSYSAPASPIANVGKTVQYNTGHLQHEHVDQPLVGFGETVKDPVGWATGHLTPVVTDSVSLLVGGTGSTPHQH